MSDYRESPLHYASAEGNAAQGAEAGIVFHEKAHRGHINLRGNPEDQAFQRGVAQVLGTELPLEPCSFSATGQNSIYWMGPNEWLVIVEGGTEGEVQNRLRQTLSGHFSVVDVSGGQTLVELSGRAVDLLLKKSCVYDFHPCEFASGRCVQTTFAKASALVSKLDEKTFQLVIRRSFSDYLFSWILDAASEYGVEIRVGT